MDGKAIEQEIQAKGLTAPRVKKPRAAYLSADVLQRAADDGEVRLVARVRKMRG